MTQMIRSRRSDLNTLQREIDRMFNAFFPSTTDEGDASSRSQTVWTPRTDLVESNEAYVLALDLPGVSREDVTINFDDNRLTISGERHSTTTGENADYLRVERSYGRFFRAFTLPHTVDSENIQAQYDNGVLTVTLPKHEQSRPRQIEVK